MHSPATTVSPTSGPHPRLTPNLDGWRLAWNHALARYYRARPRWRLSSRLGTLGVWLVWGLCLVGTALGVALYPEATNVTCDWFTCHYPLIGVALNGLLSDLMTLFFTVILTLGVGGPVVLLGVLVVSVFVPSVSKRLRRGPRGPQIATAWQNGAIELLTITPLGPRGLVRVRFLTRLYGLWQHRALIAMLFGIVATYFVSLHVLYPIFWWLGPWRQWAAQLVLVLLWCGALVVWSMALAAYATLGEVTYTARSSGMGPTWSIFSMLTLIAMFVTPFLVAIPYFRAWGSNLSYHDSNTLTVVSVPLIMIGVGMLYTGINYRLAGWIFRLRLRSYTF